MIPSNVWDLCLDLELESFDKFYSSYIFRSLPLISTTAAMV